MNNHRNRNREVAENIVDVLRQDGMDGRDESWSSSCRVTVILILVLAVDVVVVVAAAAARNRAPVVCVCWFVVDASNVCARARRWTELTNDGQTWLMRDAFSCYLTSGNESEKQVRFFARYFFLFLSVYLLRDFHSCLLIFFAFSDNRIVIGVQKRSTYNLNERVPWE